MQANIVGEVGTYEVANVLALQPELQEPIIHEVFNAFAAILGGRLPLLSAIYACTALRIVSTSVALRESCASLILLIGFNAVKTVTANAEIITITINNSMRMKPSWLFCISLICLDRFFIFLKVLKCNSTNTLYGFALLCQVPNYT